MKANPIVMLAVAGGCGLVGMLGVQKYLAGNQPVQTERVKVLVARDNIEAGVPLDSTVVAFKAMPKEAVPPGAITKDEQYAERALKQPVFSGTVILQAQLGNKGEFGATIEIPKGMRVASVPVNATMTHSGMMKPGDRVDVLVTYRTYKRGAGYVSRTKSILEFIEVYATGATRQGKDDPKSTSDVKNVSLLVNPDQASVLQLARSKGELHLTLRNRNDSTAAQTVDVDDSKLESMQALFDEVANKDEELPAAPAEPVPTVTAPVVAAVPVVPGWRVNVYNGSQVTAHEFQGETPVELTVPNGAAKPAANGASGFVNMMQKLLTNKKKPGAATEAAAKTPDSATPAPAVPGTGAGPESGTGPQMGPLSPVPPMKGATPESSPEHVH